MALHQRQIALKSIEGENWVGKKILDVGCSNGSLSFEIYEKTGASELVGVDVNVDRINLANKMVRDKNLSNVIFQEGGADDLNFPNNSFDLVFSNMAFQQFQDKERALSEIYRVLKVGGTAMINFNIEKSPVWYQQEVIYNKLFGDPNKVISREKTFKAELFEPMTKSAGFSRIDIKIEDDLFYYSELSDVLDKMDVSYFAKQKNLTIVQNDLLNTELERYLELTREDQGIPESWKVLFAKLAK